MIDLDEAKELIEQVRMPNATEEELARCFPWVSRDPAVQAAIWQLNKDQLDEQISATAADAAGDGKDKGGGADNAAAPAAPDSGAAHVRSIK